MAKRITLELSQSEQQALCQMRDHDTKPYLRERAAALLKIAGGTSPRQVALFGLLRPRQPDTVYRWLHRYRSEGLAGLPDRPGRGRKPSFSPPAP